MHFIWVQNMTTSFYHKKAREVCHIKKEIRIYTENCLCRPKHKPFLTGLSTLQFNVYVDAWKIIYTDDTLTPRFVFQSDKSVVIKLA